jgi:RHS repeat-associated protein
VCNHLCRIAKSLRLLVTVSILLTSLPVPVSVAVRAAPAPSPDRAETVTGAPANSSSHPWTPLVPETLVERGAQSNASHPAVQGPVATTAVMTPSITLPVAPVVTSPVTTTPAMTLPVTSLTGTLSITATLRAAPAVTRTLTAAGGELASRDGQIRVIAPSGVVSRTQHVSIRALASPLRADQMGTALYFSLDPDLRFTRPVTLSVGLQNLVSFESLPAGWQPFLAYLKDPARDEWEYVPLKEVNRRTGVITAEVEHFSVYGAGVISENGWQLLFNDVVVDGFRGSLSYQYPLEVPPGRGGVQPNLALTYNSDRVDGILADVQSDWAGLGWSLDAPQIVRKVHWCTSPGYICTDTSHPDYTLVIGGVGYTLVPAPGTNPNEVGPNYGAGRYYTHEETGFYVEKRLVGSTGVDTYWIVKARNGTEYEFGNTEDAKQVLRHVAGLDPTRTVYRWRVNRIEDAWENAVEFDYYEHDQDNYYGERQSYLSHIQYNQKPDTTWGVHIYFDLLDRPGGLDGTDDSHNLFFQDYYLDKVRILQGGQRVREYWLGYDFDGDSRRLQSVTEHGSGGSSSLPATTFEYSLFNNTDEDWDCCDDNYPYSRLTAVNNGYGGRIEVDYEQKVGKANHFYHYRVLERRTKDGLGNTARRLYSYGAQCFDATGSACDDGYRNWMLKGYAWCAEEVRDYDNAVLNKTTDTFILGNIGDGRWPLTGRVEEHTVADDQGQVQRRVETEWEYDWIVPSDVDYPTGAAFYYVSETETTDYSGGATVETRVTYDSYDAYGNLTQRTEYDESGAAYRRTLWGYYPNTTLGIWIVGKPGWENVYSWTGSAWSLEASTWYAYDGDPRYDGQIGDNANDKGTLSAVRSWRGAGVPSSECVIDVRYGYDGWGNRTSETTYDGYGDYDTFASAGPHVTTIAYDSTYHLYPEQVCNALNHCSGTQYYGVDGVAADYGLPGQVKKVTDPNNASTEYRYDAFGRSTHVRAPYDPGWEWDQVSAYAAYTDFGQAGRQRIVAASGQGAVWQERYLDGLGRTIQVHESADGGQEVRHSTEYDGLGRAVKEWVPYYGTHGENNYGYVPPSGSLPKTTIQYDALGRVVRVLNPDGTASSTMYAGRYTTQVDANGHYKFAVSDAFGRLARVDETVTTLEDPFGSLNSSTWTFSGHQSIDGGTLKNAGTGGDYNANFYRTSYSLSTKEGIKVEFKVSQGDAAAHFALETSDGGVYRRWGVIANSNKIYVQFNNGSGYQYPADLINPIQVGKWYVLTLKVGENGWFYTEVWQKDDPAVRNTYLGQMATGKNWRFHHWIYRGTAWLDNYHELGYQVTAYAYDVLDNLTAVTDALDNVTSMTYDPLSRKTDMDDPDMGDWTYDYDSAGNLVRQTDAENQRTCFYYDELNRLKGKTYSTGTGDCPADPDYGGYAVEYYYDQTGHGAGIGRRTVMIDDSGSTSWTYDARGRVTEESKTINGAGTFVTAYDYNALDQVENMTYPDGEVVHHDYNSRALLAGLSGSDSYVEEITYDAPGRVDLLELGNERQTDYVYYNWDTLNGLGRLQRIKTGTSASPTSLQDLRYVYDAVGNVVTIEDWKAGSPQTQSFTYDALDRLKTAVASGGSGAYSQKNYVYDEIGNITVKDGASYYYAANQPHAVQALLVGGPYPIAEYDYDANGNMISRDENDVEYTQDFDAENRLVRVTASGETTEFIYDGDGNRVLRTEPDGMQTAYVGGHYEMRLGSEHAPVYSKDFSTSHGWLYPEYGVRPNGGVAEYRYTSTGGSAYYMKSDGHFTVPEGATVRVRLTRDFASGNMSIRLYEGACSSSSSCSGKPAFVFSLPVGSGEAEVVRHDLGGKTIRTIRLYRGHSGGSTAEASYLKIYIEFPTYSKDFSTSHGWSYPEYGVRPNEGTAEYPYTYQGGSAYYMKSDGHFTVPEEATVRVRLTRDFASGDMSIRLYEDACSSSSSCSGKPAFVFSTPVGSGEAEVVRHDLGGKTIRTIRLYRNHGGGSTAEASYLRIYIDANTTKYYYAANQRVAMNRNGVVYYLHGDHLGSTSLATTAGGGEVPDSRTLYYPYGQVRWPAGGSTLPTDYTFTGQRDEAGLGLMDYHARFYDPYLGRFISADTIVPEPGNPQDLNRYSYVLGNPLKYRDPSGHCVPGEPGCLYDEDGNPVPPPPPSAAAYVECMLKTGFDDVRRMLFPTDQEISQALRAPLPESINNALDQLQPWVETLDWGLSLAMLTTVPTDLHAFGRSPAGSQPGPRPPRIGTDVFPDELGMIGPESPPFPNGASTFADPNKAPLSGHYYVLPEGTQLSEGLAVTADGSDISAASPHPETHHTIFPSRSMLVEKFIELYESLPWVYGGKK